MTSGTAPDADHLRGAFTRFFAERGHTPVPSASLIPHDPSVLFTIAGMVPFKPFFLGDEVPPWPRATSVQKCFRTVDIDIVGTTERHCTFFEMLGNFSFGDYFKAEAIPFAWELVTEVLGIDGERLWVTVYESDDEAEQIWRDARGRPAGRGSNGWATTTSGRWGTTGPCGPSSELFFDKGPAYGADGWSGLRRLRALRRDLEPRVHAVQPQSSTGSTEDLPEAEHRHRRRASSASCPCSRASTRSSPPTSSVPMIETAQSITGHTYGATTPTSTSACGSWPTTAGPCPCWWPTASSRPTRAGATCSAGSSAGPCAGPASSGVDGAVTPRLVDAAVGILGAGLPGAGRAAPPDPRRGRTRGGGLPAHPGHRLHHPRGGAGLRGGGGLGGPGLPPPRHLRVPGRAHRGDRRRRPGSPSTSTGFEAAMDVQRAQARAAARAGQTPAGEQAYRSVLDNEGQTVFVGQRPDGYSAPARVVAVLADLDPDRPGQAEIFLDRTPFYAEGGGQVGDTGTIVTETGTAVVYDTVSALPGLTSHRATITGELFAGQDALATIDGVRRDVAAPQPHRHPPAPCRPADRPRRPRPPAGLPGGPGLPALRLQPPRQRDPRGAGRRGVDGQRRRADRRRRRRGGDVQGRGRGHGGPGLLRRQVR